MLSFNLSRAAGCGSLQADEGTTAERTGCGRKPPANAGQLLSSTHIRSPVQPEARIFRGGISGASFFFLLLRAATSKEESAAQSPLTGNLNITLLLWGWGVRRERSSLSLSYAPVWLPSYLLPDNYLTSSWRTGMCRQGVMYGPVMASELPD